MLSSSSGMPEVSRSPETLTSTLQPDERETKNPTLKDQARRAAEAARSAIKPPRQHVSDYLGLLIESATALARMLAEVAEAHAKDADVHSMGRRMATWTQNQVDALRPFVERYGDTSQVEPKRLARALSPRLQPTGVGLVRDLQDCWLMANEIHICLCVLKQAALALRDERLKAVVLALERQNKRQRSWLQTRILSAAPQALIVPE